MTIKRLIRDVRLLGSGFKREEIETYSLNHDDIFPHAHQFLSHVVNKSIVRPKINAFRQSCLLEDKLALSALLFSANISCPRIWGYFHPIYGYSCFGSELKCARDLKELILKASMDRVVLKPRGGRLGRNIYVIDRLLEGERGECYRVNGTEVDLVEFIESLTITPYGDYTDAYDGWIVQEYVQQEESLSELNPSSLNTIRVITFRGHNDEIFIVGAALRVGRLGSYIDNMDKGGVAVSIDSHSGQCGVGKFKAQYGSEVLTSHPDSGILFSGLSVPEWAEVCRICVRAASLVPTVRSIGWDVGCTPSGPTIIEANSEWGLISIQRHIGTGLLSGVYGEELRRLGICLPEALDTFPVALLKYIFHKLHAVVVR
ncbi:sugar-transfer associated ATP-grasp domain-containing protein [Kineobactrum salinum]|uniref:Alpha-L-glutamate ligase-related protein ATP-grasp domain-containing protein n=1 Tax=Kineobactrum salinum TaxID=2708301 RepID=A0A6C0U2W2_9GAMM|nr:sugar-transfer associated ATP-grasp domain-containing protein [Kineobactrum salinum]QIB64705.1 hypothetical protein G3T16_04175 [Kineobactrum salinum]